MYNGNAANAVLAAKYLAEWEKIAARRNSPYLRKTPRQRVLDYRRAADNLSANPDYLQFRGSYGADSRKYSKLLMYNAPKPESSYRMQFRDEYGNAA